ncbi:diacylglycerol kinase [Flavobacterium salilacus subsp. salilacus]|uniref:diacylglycerol/lipid kinase family protein n=1 Tax=Flavobacterium TaxID=237 RepID=UPI0010752DE8|nr:MULTISPECIES: diacylglycerol kinase family protein [Flavobacterium]KAF2519863.1 diacylglycerol kinase [Flavobacterium salilacus subsp. salilacus]MBE1614233.1 diacylglycerol kinase [Flavobacterium sp. SaA2.13]
MAQQEIFLFVINPIAGGNDKSDLIEKVKLYAEDRGVTLICYETTGDNDEEAIRKLVDEHNPQRILVAGGDGTIKMVAEATLNQDVIIAVLPAGSANGLSVDLNLPDTVEANLEVAFNGVVKPMDIITINGKNSLHLSDIGVNADLIRNYENGSMRGKLGYALQALNTLTDLGEPFNATIKANGESIETEARMVVIANTNRYGTGVTINPVGKMDDGKFEIVILKNLDILVIGKILSGNIPVDENENIVIISTDEALITTNISVSFQIDGEFCGSVNELDIKIIHPQLKMIVPKPI